MKRYLAAGLISFLLLLYGCASKSVPEWKTASFNHLEQYKKYFLAGREQLAAIHFQKAVDEIKKSGNLSLLMTAYLTRSALQVAVLEAPRNTEYLEIAKIDPADDQDNQKDYVLLLAGKFDQLQKNNLPAAYQDLAAVLEGGNEERIPWTIREIQDDLSRLIAIGLVVRYRMEDEAILSSAVDLSSANGWRKPLLIYLDRLESFYRKIDQDDKAERIRLKSELLKS